MSQIRTRPVELFRLASKGINMCIICCWLPNTLHGIIVSQATCLWEVPLSESRSSANKIRCEWQFSPTWAHRQKLWRLDFFKHIVLPWLLPTLKLIDFLRYLFYPLEIFAGCPHSRFLHQQWTSFFVLWGIQRVSEKLRKFLFHVYLSPAKKEVLLGEMKILAGNPLSINASYIFFLTSLKSLKNFPYSSVGGNK